MPAPGKVFEIDLIPVTNHVYSLAFYYTIDEGCGGESSLLSGWNNDWQTDGEDG